MSAVLVTDVQCADLLLFSNVVVHSHIRNMSMAGVIPRSRPTVTPKIRQSGDGDRSSEESLRDGAKVDPLIKERSPLADMLYLRCKLGHWPVRLFLIRFYRARWPENSLGRCVAP